jgi:hydrogenase/urease accessory protein HupE
VARQYLRLGIRHILTGYDHLLFLVCLLLIAGTGRRIFWTITGFTLAHSLTLVLSTLGWVRVPVAPVEASIALSIVFVAWEILRGDRNSLAFRHPIAISSAFGLLHGFGFASVLSETGLPQTEIPAALLFFNLGVEIGQLLFVVGLILAYQLVRGAASAVGLSKPALTQRLSRMQKPLIYAVGALASFWMIQRIASFWTG